MAEFVCFGVVTWNFRSLFKIFGQTSREKEGFINCTYCQWGCPCGNKFCLFHCFYLWHKRLILIILFQTCLVTELKKLLQIYKKKVPCNIDTNVKFYVNNKCNTHCWNWFRYNRLSKGGNLSKQRSRIVKIYYIFLFIYPVENININVIYPCRYVILFSFSVKINYYWINKYNKYIISGLDVTYVMKICYNLRIDNISYIVRDQFPDKYFYAYHMYLESKLLKNLNILC